MSYNCDNCSSPNAKKNNIVNMLLCKNCQEGDYKLICKSDVIKKYKLTKNDIDNFDCEEFYTKNPHNRTGSLMILYYEKEIKNYIIEKYNNVINNELNILNPENNLDETIKKLLEHLQNKKKNTLETQKDKILDKYNINLEHLPIDTQKELQEVKTKSQYEKIIKQHKRKTELLEILKLNNFEKYIELDICSNFINGVNNLTKHQVVDYIINSLEKKDLIIKRLNENNVNYKKYEDEINEFINCKNENVGDFADFADFTDTENFAKELIEQENRYISLVSKLEERGLELRSDSKLCNDFLNGNSSYTVDYIVDVMEEMKWFYENTDYPYYCDNYKSDNYYYYDREEYNKNRSNYAKNEVIKDYIDGKISVKPPQSLIGTIEKYRKKFYKYSKGKNQAQNQSSNQSSNQGQNQDSNQAKTTM